MAISFGCPLDSTNDWRRSLLRWSVCSLPELACLHGRLLPTIRCEPVRCHGLHQIGVRSWCHHGWKTALPVAWYRRCEHSTGWHDGTVYLWGHCLASLWTKAEGQIEIHGKVLMCDQARVCSRLDSFSRGRSWDCIFGNGSIQVPMASTDDLIRKAVRMRCETISIAD